MRHLMTGISLFLFVLSVLGQETDSLAVARQVDSLIQISRALTATHQFDKALETNAAAEKIALDYFGRNSAAYASCCFNHGRVLHFKNDLGAAEKWYLESKEIRSNVLGKEHPNYAWSLNNLGNLYKDIGAYEKAEPLLLEAKTIRGNALGKTHIDYAGSLNNLTGLYFLMGQFSKAEPYSLESLAILEKTVGKEHPDYASSLSNMAGLYVRSGQYAKAEKAMLEILSILKKTVGETDPNYSSYLVNLANVYLNMGEYKKAEPLFLQAKAICENILGENHPIYSAVISNLANLYLKMDFYDKAEPYYLETLTFQEKSLGKNHPEYLGSLNELGALYLKMGNYDKAESIFLTLGKMLDKEQPAYADCANNLGILYLETGRFEEAESCYLAAKSIREKVLGKESPVYVESLNNLATVYIHIGNYQKAEMLLLEAKTIVEKTAGKESSRYAAPLINLAAVYRSIGDYEKARSFSLEALAVQEKTVGKAHSDYALSLNVLATIYLRLGNYSKAEQLHLEAKAIQEKVLGKEHPAYASTLYGLANLYLYMGVYEKGEKIHLECKAIREKVLVRENPEYALTLMGLSMIYERDGRYSRSEPLLEMLFKLSQNRLSKAVSFLSENELGKYLATFQFDGNSLSSFLQARPDGQQGILPGITYNYELFRKGFLLLTANRLNVLPASAPKAKAIGQQLAGCRRRLAAEMSKPIAEQNGMEALVARADSLEKVLAHTVAGYAEAIRQTTWQEVRSALQKDEAAIEFVHFTVGFSEKTDSILYAALLLLPGAKEPVFIPLFDEKQLDSLLLTRGERKADYVNSLYAVAERGATPVSKPQKSLYDLLWKPLKKNIGSARTIYFSPSGLLHRLNLGAIPTDEGETLADHYRLVEMTSTRQLVVGLGADIMNQNTGNATLWGGVQYEMDSTAMSTANVEIDPNDMTSRGTISFANTDSTFRVGTWNYLKWTEKETAALEQILKNQGIQTESRKGYAASEEAFKSLGQSKPAPRILHIATHGFFFPDPKQKRVSSERVSSEQLSSEREPVFRLSDHPMIRSGLVLAGANYAWRTGKPLREGVEDGILTAYEISQMNLSNTELVVLSACETGLGDIQGNEGVYGLQRAFKIAGVKYLVMSLWQVPDQETSIFMTAFYRHWLENKKSIPDAFRTTQQEMRERFINPYQWAGFILVE